MPKPEIRAPELNKIKTKGESGYKSKEASDPTKHILEFLTMRMDWLST